MERKPSRKVANHMLRPTFERWYALVPLLCLVMLAGCATTDSDVPFGNETKLTDQQRQWWEQNRHQARYIPGRGYYVEQVGYFDESGRPIDAERPGISPSVDPSADDDEGFSVRSFSPGQLVDATTQMVTGKANETSARTLFREGQDLFQRQKYAEAREKFSTAAKRWPDSPLEEDSLFFVAECEYFTDRWPQADEAYAALVKKHTNTRHLDQVSRRRFSIAKYWETQQQKNKSWAITPNFFNRKSPLFDAGGRALRTYEGIMNTDTRSELADTAIMAVGDALYADNRFEEADFRYQMLIKDYSQSKYLYQAHQQSLKCKLQMYEGKHYDSTPLTDAEELLDQMLAQFPHQARTDHEVLMKFRREIRAAKANEDWTKAEFYANRKEYRAARVYYEKIAKLYPDTNLAAESLARIERYQHEPDQAPHPLEWATRWLPRAEEKPATRTVDRSSRDRR